MPGPRGNVYKAALRRPGKVLNAMSFNYLKKLPTPADIRAQYPLSEQGRAVKQAKDAAIRDIITGKSDKFLVVIGPC